MPVTMTRVNMVKGLGPVIQIAEGWTVELPEEIHTVLDKRTDPTWPTTWFVPRLGANEAFKDVYNVMANWGANHGAISYGHIGADLITLASILRIPVNMHNVPEEKYSGQVHGQLLVPIKKEPTTGLVATTDLFINKLSFIINTGECASFRTFPFLLMKGKNKTRPS